MPANMLLQRDDSATFSVNSALKRGSSSSTLKKSVQFSEESNEHFTIQRRTVKEHASCFYTHANIKSFKDDIRNTILMAAKQFKQLNDNKKKTVSSILKDLYFCARKVDYILEDAAKLLTKKQRKQLASLFATEQNIILFLGCEYLISKPSVKDDLADQRCNLQNMVKDVQLEFLQGVYKTRDDMEQEMAESLQAETQGAALFAQFLALAVVPPQDEQQ